MKLESGFYFSKQVEKSNVFPAIHHSVIASPLKIFLVKCFGKKTVIDGSDCIITFYTWCGIRYITDVEEVHYL